MNDLDLIIGAARDAGELAMRLQTAGLDVSMKEDGSPVSGADLAVDALLADRLCSARPDYGWLSEESPDDKVRLKRRRVFVVDPIDGTRAFVRGRPQWAVCIAVVEDGRPTAGVVHVAALSETYSASQGGGAFLNGKKISASATDRLEGCRMLGDEALFGHPAWPRPWPAMAITRHNAIAYRMVLVASGAFDAAVAMSPKSDWDLAASSLVASEAGAAVCDHKGRPLVFNTPAAKAPSMVCAAKGVFPLILELTSPIDLRG